VSIRIHSIEMFHVNLKRKNTILLYSFKYYKTLKQNYDERFQVSIGAKSVTFVSTRNNNST